MPWSDFFQSRACKWGAVCGGAGLALGATASAVLAMKMSSACSSLASGFIHGMGSNFTLPTLKGVIRYQDYAVPVSFENINADLPTAWVSMIQNVNELPPYCFAAPLILGMGMSVIASMALANSVALVLFIRDQNTGALQELDSSIPLNDDFEYNEGIMTP